MLSKGTRLGHYEIIGELGAGGMGRVYLARDSRLDRTVALKTIHEESRNRGDALTRFRNEARAASALNHPAIVHIYDIDEVTPILPDGAEWRFDPVLYTAMEHVRGETLREHIRSNDAGSDQLLEWFSQIADGIACAHEAGILHCDLKPENVIITPDGFVKILDFGLARLLSPGVPFDENTPTATVGSSTDGIGRGTAQYMSPEQLCGQSASAASDLFAIGCMMFEAISGRHPFHRSSTVETIHAIVYAPAPLLRAESREIPPLLEKIIMRSLEKEPGARYRSARQLAIDLREARSHTGERQLPLLRPPASRRRVTIITAALISLAVIALAIVWRASRREPEASPARGAGIASVAVLPFENRGHDPDAEYLSDGMTEAIMYDLSRSRSLRVIPRASVFRLKGTTLAPTDAAKKLGVDAVVAGVVVQRSSGLVVDAELIDGRSGALIWGNRFERDAADLVAIEAEIGRSIRDALRLEQLPQDFSTADPEAFREYLRGRFFWNKRTADGLDRAIEHFRAAIERDPGFAQAWVGLGDSYALLEQYAGIPSRENCAKAKAAIVRAQQLDASLAPAWASMGLLYAHCEWNWTRSEQAFQRAIALDPNYATAHHWFALHLAYRGQFARALDEARRAQELDPLSLIAGNAQSVVQGYAGNWPAVVAQSDRLLEMDESFAVAHMWKGRALRAEGKFDDAERELERGLALTGGRSPELVGELGSTYALAGRRTDAEKLVRRLQDETLENRSVTYSLAVIDASLGDREAAFAALQKAFGDHSWFLVQMQVEPLFAPLRSDPRFREMLIRLRLSDAARSK